MRIPKISLLIVLALLVTSCQAKQKEKEPVTADHHQAEENKELQDLEKAYFASGCFWCVEAIFESVKGVEEVVSGYAGGSEENPTYQQVAAGRTSHAEAVEVYYDPEVITFEELVAVFFGSHDPTTLNRQGPDRGPQYRSIAFYNNPEERKIITDYIAQLERDAVYDDTIVTEVSPIEKFYVAEEYHQDFEKKNPNNSYIRNISIPRFERFKQKFPEYVENDHH